MAHMYETYVSEATGERRPPTIADIVRQEDRRTAHASSTSSSNSWRAGSTTPSCATGSTPQSSSLSTGTRAPPAYIADHGDEPCDHCESRKRGPRSRKEAHTTPGVLHARLITYDFINLLTEDFLTVLSAVDEDLMIRLVRAQTNHCETVVEFLDAVMYNRVDGFKANHRIAAARELISHIIRDEQRSRTPCPGVGFKPANLVRAEDATVPLSLVGAGLKPALPGAARKPGLSAIPEKCLRPEQLRGGDPSRRGAHNPRSREGPTPYSKRVPEPIPFALSLSKGP